MKYESRKSFLKYAALAAAFVLVRCLFIYAVHDSWYLHEEVSPAAETYKDKVLRFEESARNIVGNLGYVIHCEYYDKYISYLHEYPPGFSFLLAGLYRFGLYGRLFAQAAQICASMVTLLIVILITRMVGTPRAGVIAAVIIAFNPILARFDVAIEPAVTAMMLISIALYVLLVSGRGSVVRFAGAGLLAGGASLLISDFTFLPVFFLIALAFTRGVRFTARYGTALIAGYLIALSPLVVMNHRTFGRLMIAPPFTGVGLVRGFGQFGGEGELYMPEGRFDLLASEGFYRPGENPWIGWEEIVIYYPDPFEKDARRRARAIAFAKDHPAFVLWNTVKKIPRMYGGNITGVTPDYIDARAGRIENEPSAGGPERAAAAALRGIARLFRRFRWLEWAAVLLAIAGFIISIGNWRKTLLIASIPVYLFMAHLPFFFEARMMTPALPFIYIFTAICLDAMVGRRRREAAADA